MRREMKRNEMKRNEANSSTVLVTKKDGLITSQYSCRYLIGNGKRALDALLCFTGLELIRGLYDYQKKFHIRVDHNTYGKYRGYLRQ